MTGAITSTGTGVISIHRTLTFLIGFAVRRQFETQNRVLHGWEADDPLLFSVGMLMFRTDRKIGCAGGHSLSLRE